MESYITVGQNNFGNKIPYENLTILCVKTGALKNILRVNIKMQSKNKSVANVAKKKLSKVLFDELE